MSNKSHKSVLRSWTQPYLRTWTSTKSLPKKIPKTNKSSSRTRSPSPNLTINNPLKTANCSNPTQSGAKVCSTWNLNTNEANSFPMYLNSWSKSNFMTSKKPHRALRDCGNRSLVTSKDKLHMLTGISTCSKGETKGSLLPIPGNL